MNLNELCPGFIDEEHSKLRAMFSQLNVLSRADGSAFFAQGQTCALASVTGVAEGQAKSSSLDGPEVEAIYKLKCGSLASKEKLRDSIVRENLIMDVVKSQLCANMLPRLKLCVQVQELDDDFGMGACAINACLMAMLIAGVPLKHTLAAVQVIVTKDNELIMDPDNQQAKDHLASFLFVFEGRTRKITMTLSIGVFNQSQFNNASDMASLRSEEIFSFQRKTLQNFHNQSLPFKTVSKNKKEEISNFANEMGNMETQE